MINVTAALGNQDPLDYCGVVVDQVHAHYQSQLVSQLWMYFLAGVVLGLLLCWLYKVWKPQLQGGGDT